MMKVFKVTFHMNNGEVLDFELKRPATYDVYKKIEEANHWFKLNNEIINLLNVNSIHVANYELPSIYSCVRVCQ